MTFTETVQDVLAVKATPSIPRLIAPAAGSEVNAAAAPQLVLGLLAAGRSAITNPLGKLSLKLIPVKSVVVFGLLIVKVRLVLPLIGIALSVKALLSVGAEITVKESVAALPDPALVAVTIEEVLFLIPPVVAVTSTLIRQATPGATDAPETVSVVLPAFGANVGEPQFVTSLAGVAATCKPAGNPSVKATPLIVVSKSELVTRKVRVLVSPTRIVFGLKALLMAGGATTTRLAGSEAGPAPPSKEVTSEVVLTFSPWLVPYTRTLTVQVVAGAIIAFPKERLVSPEAGAKVGLPQPEVLDAGVLQTASPDGKVSEKPTPLRVLSGLRLTRLKLRVL